MSAYFLVEVDVTNPQLYEEYRKLVGPTLEKYHGKFLVRGGASKVIEGEWPELRRVIIEFATTEQFYTWYNSPEYTEARAIRFRTSNGRAILLDGI
ncbi:DUF1330 domain-containing protein [Tengunoibacter tsumagoiensis]|uniref:DUF1330 domain-containing protein n=1 Tax=Tengunoibacter tsumagoiensis TaxID=2014871 RepID=A0A402AA05_9CHLR|nr:DUF1330 domain-containing protein [Tengunoibacter tsumagoiensis]GCE15928.1 hypothetical protein KTT_57870 [Tengunoibacter tsumagoiensis]